MLKKLIYTCVVLLVSTAAFADDFAAPWYRGEPLSAEVEWEFSSQWDGLAAISPDNEKYVDDDDPNTFLYDKFPTHIDLDSASDWTWVDADGDGGMQANVDASFACNIINWVDEMPEKLLRIQITYIGQAPTIESVAGYGYYSPPEQPETYVTEPFGRTDVDEGYVYWDFEIYPNPEYEHIIVNVPDNTIIDQIYFDSVSPEPATLALLAVGGIGLLRRCRK